MSEREDLLLRHGLEQAKPDHRRGDARRNHDVGTDRTIAKVGQRIMRRAKRDALAVSQLHLLLRVLDLQLAFGVEALDRAILKLAAISRLGQGVHPMRRELCLLLIACGRHRQSDQHRAGIVAARRPRAGGWPRPSFKWQSWQPRELNSGPSPSEASVEDGADTQSLRKMALPILKLSSRLKSILPEESEKALVVLVEPREVAPPPGFSSPGSSLVKSAVGASRLCVAASTPWP